RSPGLRRKRDEAFVVEIRQLHPAGPPIGFRLLDSLLRRGDEVPLDEAWPQGFASQRHDDGRGFGTKNDCCTWSEHQHLAGFKDPASDLDPPLGHINGPLWMIMGQFSPSIRFQYQVQVEERGMGGNLRL